MVQSELVRGEPRVWYVLDMHQKSFSGPGYGVPVDGTTSIDRRVTQRRCDRLNREDVSNV